MNFFAAICVLLVAAVAADKTATVGDIKLEALDKAGNITLTNTKDVTNAITIHVDSIQEIDNAGNEVTEAKHFLKNVALETFVVAEDANSKVPGNGPAAHKISLTLDMSQVKVKAMGTLVVDCYLVKAKGSYKNADNKDVNVLKGDLKFTIKINDWVLCDKCGSAGKVVGTNLDVNIKVKGKTDATFKKGSNTDVDLGGGSMMFLNNLVKEANKKKDMPAGYPKLDKGIFTIRFPKFAAKAALEHDPIARVGPPMDKETTTPASTTATTAPTEAPTTGAAAHAPWMLLVVIAAFIKAFIF